MPSSSYSTSSYFATSAAATYVMSGYNWQPGYQPWLNPKLPKPGDLVRDQQGRAIGYMDEDGCIALADGAVQDALAAVEANGVPVEPQTVRRAIDLSFGRKDVGK